MAILKPRREFEDTGVTSAEKKVGRYAIDITVAHKRLNGVLHCMQTRTDKYLHKENSAPSYYQPKMYKSKYASVLAYINQTHAVEEQM